MDEKIFTKEQLEELTKISKLSEEEQKKVLPNFLKKLSPEQFSYLKQAQPQQCPLCLIVENKIKAKKIYEDKEILAVLEINPVNPGHTLVFPKKHFELLAQLKEVGNLFNVVNKISSVLFETLKAQGTNILVSNGSAAGQNIPHLVVKIIPRFAKDKIRFNLEPKKAGEEELEEILSKIKTIPINVEKKEEKKPEVKPVKLSKEERIP